MNAFPTLVSLGIRALRRVESHSALGVLALTVAMGCTDPAAVSNQDACQTYRPIEMGQTLDGTLDSGDCRFQLRYRDFWTLTVSSQTIVQIDLASTAFDAFLELHTETGGLLASNDNTNGSDSRIVVVLPAGTYHIVASSFDSSALGGYSLSVTLGTDCSPLGSLELGQPVSGELGPSDCLFAGIQRGDNWTLDLSSTTTVRLAVASGDFEPLVIALDGQSILDFDADDGEGLARFEAELGPGSYTVVAAATVEEPVGAYELTASVAPACTPGTQLVLGEQVSGELGMDDCMLSGAGSSERWGLEVTDAGTYVIQMESAAFAPLVLLRTSAGSDVALARDSTATGRATITYALDPGSYELAASTISSVDGGAYTLSASSAPAPVPAGRAASVVPRIVVREAGPPASRSVPQRRE